MGTCVCAVLNLSVLLCERAYREVANLSEMRSLVLTTFSREYSLQCAAFNINVVAVDVSISCRCSGFRYIISIIDGVSDKQIIFQAK